MVTVQLYRGGEATRILVAENNPAFLIELFCPVKMGLS